MTFRIEVEWMEGTGVRDPGEAATWARLEFHVGAVVVSEIHDSRDGSVRRGFFGSTLPLAEWLVEVWPRLLHERRQLPAVHTEWPEWAGYHHLRAARQGGALPDLQLSRYNDDGLVVQATEDRDALAPGLSVRFLRSIREILPALVVERELARFVDATMQRVAAIQNERLDRFRRRWSQIQNDRTLAAVGRLGLDDETLASTDRASLTGATGDPWTSILLDLAEGISLEPLAERLRVAQRLLDTAPLGTKVSQRWAELGSLFVQRRDKPWLTGWDAARSFRETLNVAQVEAPGAALQGWIEARCGWPVPQQLHALPTSADGIDTLHLRRADRNPVVVTRVQRPESQRFRLARALYYFLFSRTRPRETAVVDSEAMPTAEKSEANAFAAELLAPADCLRQESPAGGAWSSDAIESMAMRLAVSPRVVEHQIANREIGWMID